MLIVAVRTLGRLIKVHPEKMAKLIASIGETLPDITERDEYFMFLDLPTEMRNRIYLELLVTTNPIVVERQENGNHWKNRPRTKYMTERSYKVRAFEQGFKGVQRQNGRLVHLKYSIPILLANKIIHKEATPIFYGANRFVFSNTPTMSEFMVRSGSNFAHLTKVDIRMISLRTTKHLRNCLFALKSPQRVELNVLSQSENFSLPAIVERLWSDIVKPFVTQIGEWQDEDDMEDDEYEDDGAYHGGSYVFTPVPDAEAQTKRFDLFWFSTWGYWEWDKLSESLGYRIRGRQQRHDAIKVAVLERWNSEISSRPRKTEEAERDIVAGVTKEAGSAGWS